MNIIQVDYPAPGSNISLKTETTTDLAIHHSAGSKLQTPLEIDAEERNAPPPNGPYAMIPYEWLIDYKGNIYTGRPLKYESAASFGRNPMSVAICLIGQFQDNFPGFEPPTEEQLVALRWLITFVHKEIPTIERTYAHGDIAEMFYPDNEGEYSTDCCGNYLRKLLPEIIHGG